MYHVTLKSLSIDIIFKSDLTLWVCNVFDSIKIDDKYSPIE